MCLFVAAMLWVLGLDCGTRAQGTTVVEPPTPLLPTSATFVSPGEGLSVPEDGAELQALLKEDGLVRSESRVTLVSTASKAAASGWVKAYQFGDATGAFSAYTYLRMGGRPVGGGRVNGTDVQTAGGERIYVSGTSVVRAKVNQYPESVDGLLKKIEVGLPKVGGRRGLAPLLPTLVPKEGVEAGSIRYAIGPAGYGAMGGVLPGGNLGWDKSLEVATAAIKGGKGSLTLLLYPTPQIAGDRGRAIERMVNEGGAGRFGTVKLRRLGPLVGMASGALTAGQAETLVGGLRLNEEVSFDQKMPLEFHTEVKKTASLLENIAVLCGVLILAAVLLGLFLGGARAGVRLLQGKSAASEPEFLTINLRDTSQSVLTKRSRD